MCLDWISVRHLIRVIHRKMNCQLPGCDSRYRHGFGDLSVVVGGGGRSVPAAAAIIQSRNPGRIRVYVVGILVEVVMNVTVNVFVNVAVKVFVDVAAEVGETGKLVGTFGFVLE
jgi:hypothetical protein